MEKAGVELGKKGEVVVDDYSRTSAPHIYAVGDVTNRLQLTPVAIHEAMCFVETAFKNNPTRPDHVHVPSAVFTTPELSVVGMSEEQGAGSWAIASTSTSPASGRCCTPWAGGRCARMMKMVVDAKTDKVLGVPYFRRSCRRDHPGRGSGAAAWARPRGISTRTIALHPTAAEELVTMRSKSYSKTP